MASITDISTATNLTMNEIKDIDKNIQDNIKEPEDLSKAQEIKNRLKSLSNAIKLKAKNSPIGDLLLDKLKQTMDKLKKRTKTIKENSRPLFDTLYEMLLVLLTMLSQALVYFAPTLIVAVIVLYIIYSDSEYATFIRGIFKKSD